MSNCKTFSPDELAGIFKALSNSNRLQIFQRLLSCCEIGSVCLPDTINGFCVGELGQHLDIAPSTLSHHIKELQHAGLIKTKRNGKNVECYVDPTKISVLKEFFSISINNAKIKM